jgi:hypothetical protein
VTSTPPKQAFLPCTDPNSILCVCDKQGSHLQLAATRHTTLNQASIRCVSVARSDLPAATFGFQHRCDFQLPLSTHPNAQLQHSYELRIPPRPLRPQVLASDKVQLVQCPSNRLTPLPTLSDTTQICVPQHATTKTKLSKGLVPLSTWGHDKTEGANKTTKALGSRLPIAGR